MAFRGFADMSNGDKLLSAQREDEDLAVYNWDDEGGYGYDDVRSSGLLGGALEEEGDAMNDETFGGGNVGSDFDFARQTGSFAPVPSRSQPAPLRQQEKKPAPSFSSVVSSKEPSGRGNSQPVSLESVWKDNSVSSVLGGLVPSSSRSSTRVTPPTQTPTPPRPGPQPQAGQRGSQPRIRTLQEIEEEMEAASRTSTRDPPRHADPQAYIPPPLPQVQPMAPFGAQEEIRYAPPDHPPPSHAPVQYEPIYDPIRAAGPSRPLYPPDAPLPPEIRPAGQTTAPGMFPSFPSGGMGGMGLDEMDLPQEIRHAGPGRMDHGTPGLGLGQPLPPDMRAAPMGQHHHHGHGHQGRHGYPQEMFYQPQPFQAPDREGMRERDIFSVDEIERQMRASQLGHGPPPPSHLPPHASRNHQQHRLAEENSLETLPPQLQPPPQNYALEELELQMRQQQHVGRDTGRQPLPSELQLLEGMVGGLGDMDGFRQQQQQPRPQPAFPSPGTLLQQSLPPQQHTPGPPAEPHVELSAEERENLQRDAMRKIMAAEAFEQKRRRKAAKLARMAPRNELMSQSDKDFITRIQVSQLVSDDPYADDFYAQVFGAIVRARLGDQGPGDAVITFGEGGGVGMGIGRGGGRREKAMARMRQQVERLVQHARAREKEKGSEQAQLMQNTLGRVANRSSKVAPRPILHLKHDSFAATPPITPTKASTDTSGVPALTRKEVLSRIERLYELVLQLEQTRREQPAEDEEDEEKKRNWSEKYAGLAKELWDETHVMDPLDISDPHPVISLLEPMKGKKLLPRMLRHLSEQESLTIVTLLVACFNQLDVVRGASVLDKPDEGREKKEMEEQTEAFQTSVLPSLIGALRRSGLRLVSFLLKHLVERCNVAEVARTKPGLELLTMFLAQAEGLKHAPETPPAADLELWETTHHNLFSALSGTLLTLFPSVRRHSYLPFGPAQYIRPTAADDLADQPIWQFLAALAVNANMTQQQQLVAELRDKVLENVISQRNGLATNEEEVRLKIGNVNLFLNALGIDSSQIQM